LLVATGDTHKPTHTERDWERHVQEEERRDRPTGRAMRQSEKWIADIFVGWYGSY